MPQVKFEKQISLAPKEAFDKLKGLLDGASELKKIDPDIVLTVKEEDMSVLAEGSKINGTVSIQAYSKTQSTVKVDLSIPWAFAPFKSIITSKLEEKIAELC